VVRVEKMQASNRVKINNSYFVTKTLLHSMRCPDWQLLIAVLIETDPDDALM